MGEQVQRQYGGGPSLAEKALQADRVQAAAQGWKMIGKKWEGGFLVALYERQAAATPVAEAAPWAAPQPGLVSAPGAIPAQQPTVPTYAPVSTTVGGDAGQLLIGAGVAWIVAAAAAGYLALEQFNAANVLSRLGADNSVYMQNAAFNGIGAVITIYFGARMIMKADLAMWSMVWAIVSLASGGYQIANGVSAPEFVLSVVAAAVAGVLSFAAWNARTKF